MKKILSIALLGVSVTAFAAEKKNEYDIRPGEDKINSAPTAVVWQNENEAALAEAVSDDALAEAASSEANALKLLKGLKGAYLTDPMTATRIAAVSQWVMGSDAWYEFWKPSRENARRVWAKALFARARDSYDAYVRQFYLDQLRWCGYPCQGKCIRALAEKEGAGEVKSLAEMVATELESCR